MSGPEFRAGDWVRCTHPKAKGEHGLVLGVDSFEKIRVRWDNPNNLIAAFVTFRILEPSSDHTLWLADLIKSYK